MLGLGHHAARARAATIAAPTSATGRTHTTIYLHKRVLRELKAIALEYDRKPHDILIEGVNAALAHYGRPSVEELSKG